MQSVGWAWWRASRWPSPAAQVRRRHRRRRSRRRCRCRPAVARRPARPAALHRVRPAARRPVLPGVRRLGSRADRARLAASPLRAGPPAPVSPATRVQRPDRARLPVNRPRSAGRRPRQRPPGRPVARTARGDRPAAKAARTARPPPLGPVSAGAAPPMPRPAPAHRVAPARQVPRPREGVRATRPDLRAARPAAVVRDR
jgi:hypothetical protein